MSELVNTNCPHCGAGIQVNPEFKEQLVCRYCGSTFMVKDVVTNYNFTTINNYNDISQSTYDGIMGKRKVFLDELEKMKTYFSQKEELYSDVIRIKNYNIPNCIREEESKIKSIYWMASLGTMLAIII